MNRYYRLLAYGYFPKEIPPIFSTRNFAKYAHKLKDIKKYAGSKWQRSCPYFLQQRLNYRRKLDILSPQSILKQAYIISENYEDLQDKFTKLDGNCSRPAFNRKTKFQRAVRPFTIGRGYTQRRLDLRSRFPLVLKLDVKNYYRSIYTHSIPWALHGREYAKKHLRDDNLGNNLDRAVRESQDGQTIGIPTGPDTSFIIAEVILSQIIETMTNEKLIREDRFVRYYDDIEYGCEGEEEAHRILNYFEDALRRFELEVNPEKVEIFSGPQHIERPWLYQLRQLEQEEAIKTDKLLEIFSFVAELAQRYAEDHVFRYFLRKMRTSIVAEEAWEAYQKILFSLLQDNTGNMKEVFEQLTYYEFVEHPINRVGLREALDRKVRAQLSRGITSELSWALFGYLHFDLKVNEKQAEEILVKGDGPTKVLMTKIIFDRKMHLKSVVNDIIDGWNEEVLNSPEWLFAYEIMVNKWHNRYRAVKLPTNKELFEFMYQSNVSFLDDAYLHNFEIPSTFRRLHTPDEADTETVDGDPKTRTDFLTEDEAESKTTDDDIENVPYAW